MKEHVEIRGRVESEIKAQDWLWTNSSSTPGKPIKPQDYTSSASKVTYSLT